MRFASSAETEAQLAAHFEYLCALQGAQRPAYVPVVAAGYVAVICRKRKLFIPLIISANSLAIHYTNNDCRLKEGELVLMDAGCELKCVSLRAVIQPFT